MRSDEKTRRGVRTFRTKDALDFWTQRGVSPRFTRRRIWTSSQARTAPGYNHVIYTCISPHYPDTDERQSPYGDKVPLFPAAGPPWTHAIWDQNWPLSRRGSSKSHSDQVATNVIDKISIRKVIDKISAK